MSNVPAPPTEAVDAAAASPGLPVVSHAYTGPGDRAGVAICMAVIDDDGHTHIAVGVLTTAAAVHVGHKLFAHSYALGYSMAEG